MKNEIKKQGFRYLIVGIWNTFFGYIAYAFLTALFFERIPYAYMLASVIGNFFAVSQAFLLYKLFVFKTKGHWLKEYVKCWTVYSTGIAITLIGLPFAVRMCVFIMPEKYAPYAGGMMMTGIVVFLSFFGHKKLTFHHSDK